MIVTRLFSKKDKKEPKAANSIANGIILSYLGGKVGKTTGKVISQGNQVKEVMRRVEKELPKRAAAGDEKAAEALSKISSNPKGFFGQVLNITKDSPRTVKAGKVGKAVGMAVPATLVTASYLRKKKNSKTM